MCRHQADREVMHTSTLQDSYLDWMDDRPVLDRKHLDKDMKLNEVVSVQEAVNNASTFIMRWLQRWMNCWA